jgi:hypothetical protein
LKKITIILVTIFAVVGGLVGISLVSGLFEDSDIDEEGEFVLQTVEGMLLVANDNKFNSTNPDIRLAANASEELVIFNKDSSQHDLVVNDLNIKSKILNEGENFTTTIVGNKSGTYNTTVHSIQMRCAAR